MKKNNVTLFWQNVYRVLEKQSINITNSFNVTDFSIAQFIKSNKIIKTDSFGDRTEKF